MANKAFKEWRAKLGLTQEKVARELGVTLRTVQHWEAGSVEPPESVRRLMTALTAGAPHEPWTGRAE